MRRIRPRKRLSFVKSNEENKSQFELRKRLCQSAASLGQGSPGRYGEEFVRCGFSLKESVGFYEIEG